MDLGYNASDVSNGILEIPNTIGERLSPRLILEQDDYEDYRENWQQLTCRGTLLSYFNIMLLAISEKSHGLSLNNHEKYQLNFIKC